MAVYSNVKVKAYGKINLMLDVVGVRDDGYHMLNTVMQSVDVFDVLDLTLTDGEGFEIKCDREGFPLDKSNLIWKAADAFREHTKTDFGGKLTVTVEKNLPSMAGMGGGSSDCGAMLNALNIMFGTLLDEDELAKIGADLGADVPFCTLGGTRLCQGIGEITHKLSSPHCAFLIVKPDVSISTPDAFRKYDRIVNPQRCQLDYFLKGLASEKLLSMCIYMFNVLEYAAESEEIELAKKRLKDAGAYNSMMTGSGSAVFGVFENEELAKIAAEKLKPCYNYCEICKPIKKGFELISVQR